MRTEIALGERVIEQICDAAALSGARGRREKIEQLSP
jgi:hypothetical protein